MPARDAYHAAVRRALEKDGWTITHDPYLITFGVHNLYVDMGAEAPVAAEKGGRRIAVEVKSFSGPSEVTDLERGLGQYTLYRALMAERDPGRALYMALPEDAYRSIFGPADGRIVIESVGLGLLVFDPEMEVISEWLDPKATQTS